MQRQLLEQLFERRQRAFRGPLVLCLDLSTSARTPPHSHNIVKNLLDLFSTPRSGIKTRRRALLCSDDSQIHGLVVRCRHGQDSPTIAIHARSLGNLLEDLNLLDRSPIDFEDEHEAQRSGLVGFDLEHMLDEEQFLRARFGGSKYEGLLHISRLGGHRFELWTKRGET